jgi:hypothetical protein
LALPIAGIIFIALLLVIILFTYTKINKFFMGAFGVVLFGVIVNLSINGLVDNFTKVKQNDITDVITVICFSFISILLIIIGLAKKVKPTIKRWEK